MARGLALAQAHPPTHLLPPRPDLTRPALPAPGTCHLPQVRASMTIVGLLPPVWENGCLLVDGGYMNNMPVDVMRLAMGVETVLVVDVEGKDDMGEAWGGGKGGCAAPRCALQAPAGRWAWVPLPACMLCCHVLCLPHHHSPAHMLVGSREGGGEGATVCCGMWLRR